MDNKSDKKYLAKLRRKQPKAIERWFRNYSDILYTFVFYRVQRDSDLACDIVGETFLEAMGKIELYDPERGSMFAWLTMLSKNHISRALKAKGKLISYDQTWGSLDRDLSRCFERIATEPLPHSVLEQKETAELVQNTLANIPANYNKVLNEYYYHRKPLKEIASLQSTSEGAIKALLYRARIAFKEAFLRISESLDTPYMKGELNE